MKLQSISTQTLHRIPLYLNYLRSLPEGGSENISATAIAEALGLNDVQVRKDLAQVSSGGRPKIGYVTKRLIADIEEFMGYNDTRSAIVAGAGNLGRALFSYGGFSRNKGGDELIERSFILKDEMGLHLANARHREPFMPMQTACNVRSRPRNSLSPARFQGAIFLSTIRKKWGRWTRHLTRL